MPLPNLVLFNDLTIFELTRSRTKQTGMSIATFKVKANVKGGFIDNISGISNLTGLAVDIVESVTCLKQWDEKKH